MTHILGSLKDLQFQTPVVMFKSFLIFVIGLILFINIIIGYIVLPSAETELFIAVLSGVLSIVGLISMFQTIKSKRYE
jgi:hypothetical protein